VPSGLLQRGDAGHVVVTTDASGFQVKLPAPLSAYGPVVTSLDGSAFAYADDQQATVWNGVDALALSADGALLAAALADGQVRFWDATTGQPA
jgi:hypothetical protein